MAPQDIITFLKRRGHTVVETRSCWWYNEYRQSRIFQSFPCHRLVDPTEEEVGELFDALPHAMAIRFPTPMQARGKQSYMLTCRRPYSLAALSANNRSKAKRGLNRCEVRPVSWEELVREAWPAHMDTMKRHGLTPGNSLGFGTEFQLCPAYASWAAFVAGRLVACVVSLAVAGWVDIMIDRSCCTDLGAYPNSSFVFTVIQRVLSDPSVSAVSCGWECLGSRGSLEQFKE